MRRFIKVTVGSNSEESIIFGSTTMVPAKDVCPAASLNMVAVLDLESNIYMYTGPTQVPATTHSHCLIATLQRLSAHSHTALYDTSRVKLFYFRFQCSSSLSCHLGIAPVSPLHQSHRVGAPSLPRADQEVREKLSLALSSSTRPVM